MNIRKKLLALVLAAAIALLSGCASTAARLATVAYAEENPESIVDSDSAITSTVYVESEFAPLKRVVLTQSEIYFGEDEWFMLTDEEQAAWENERNELCEILEKYGVEVQRPRLLTDDEKTLGMAKNGLTAGEGVTNFFVRDPFFTIGDHIIEGAFNSTYRRLEVLPVRSILTSEAQASGCYYVAVPQPDVSGGLYSTEGPFLEGGDVLVYGKTVFVGNSGLASNEAGIQWLRSYLSHFGYEVVEVKLHEDILHLDCALSLVREGLMIVCEEALLDGIPEQLKDWEKLTVSMEDAWELATNGLPVNEEVYITDVAFKDTVGAELEAKGITVEYIDFAISRSFGGGVRCSTQPLLRTWE